MTYFFYSGNAEKLKKDRKLSGKQLEFVVKLSKFLVSIIDFFFQHAVLLSLVGLCGGVIQGASYGWLVLSSTRHLIQTAG